MSRDSWPPSVTLPSSAGMFIVWWDVVMSSPWKEGALSLLLVGLSPPPQPRYSRALCAPLTPTPPAAAAEGTMLNAANGEVGCCCCCWDGCAAAVGLERMFIASKFNAHTPRIKTRFRLSWSNARVSTSLLSWACVCFSSSWRRSLSRLTRAHRRFRSMSDDALVAASFFSIADLLARPRQLLKTDMHSRLWYSALAREVFRWVSLLIWTYARHAAQQRLLRARICSSSRTLGLRLTTPLSLWCSTSFICCTVDCT
mmetsp:Transcript_22152/g.63180  ORF Transcript_22152/g.63180 Transcript_22152/m.63180 type:complete len:256 (-) Transcript_22152:550-1317(-)